jgi:hypothetical protein
MAAIDDGVGDDKVCMRVVRQEGIRGGRGRGAAFEVSSVWSGDRRALSRCIEGNRIP